MHRFSVNGTVLAADVEGEGPGILFIHGYPLSRAIWAHQVAGLAGWRRIAPDLRGMGESDAPADGYSMAVYAADLAALLDLLGVDEVVLCGLSMGGYVAFEFLRRWRSRVRGLVLMDTRAEADTPEAKEGRDANAALARQAGAGAVAEGMLSKMLAGETRAVAPEVAERVWRMMVATPVAGIIGALEAMKERPDSTPLLSTIDTPTLVLVGAEDPITPPEQARAMAQAVRGARLAVVPGAAHLPPVERPEATTEALREFLEGIANGRGSA
jgi:3-oxoadipate enol-lactonase